MQFKGLGTQLVEAKLQRLIKDARILRIDKDTTAQKGSLDNYFKIFSSQGADVLVGTQMIAKGLDFSNLTLAIILNIDGTFNRPDFRAHEEAFQLMTQVAGRAGRSYLKGQVFIQSQNPMHPLCQKAKHSDYLSFYQHEIEERKLYSFPPFSRLMRFVFSDQDFNKLQTYAHAFRQLLTQNLPQDFMIEPLMSCFHEVIDKNYRYHFLIKGTQAIKLFQVIEWIDSTLKIPHSLKRLIDVDPQSTYF
jgi:primosomal protein N' (replication factor Y)